MIIAIASTLTACGAAIRPTLSPHAAFPSCPMRVPQFSPTGGATISLPQFSSDHDVYVCFGRKGPYAFALDSGSASTLISRTLASSLRLKPGPATVVTGGLQSATGYLLHIVTWSIGGIPMTTTTMIAIPQSSFQGESGIIGTEILSRFGAIRWNLSSNTVQFAHRESKAGPYPVPTGTSKPPLVHLAAQFAEGSRDVIPLTINGVEEAPYAVVDFDGADYPMKVDTGGAFSTVNADLASLLGLRRVGTQKIVGVGGVATVNVFDSGDWSLGGIALPEITLDEFNDLVPGAIGTLGLDILGRYTTVTIDFEDGDLLLGRRS